MQAHAPGPSVQIILLVVLDQTDMDVSSQAARLYGQIMEKTAYEMCVGDWSSDVCSSDLPPVFLPGKSIGQKRLASYSPWVAKSQTRLSMQALAPGPSLQNILRRGKTLQSHPPKLMGLTSCLHSHL